MNDVCLGCNLGATANFPRSVKCEEELNYYFRMRLAFAVPTGALFRVCCLVLH